MPFELYLAQAGLLHPHRERSSQARRLRHVHPDLVAGAGIYQKDCPIRRSLPGEAVAPIGAGMFPHAPQLLSPGGMVTDDAAGETYWKVKNGIRLTGMPSFSAVLSEDQMWQVTAVVKRADRLPPEVLATLEP